MALDPESSYDLFISYAHVDDAPVFRGKWVSTLVQELRHLLAQKMGRHEAFSIWWDEINLRGHHAITLEIRTTLQKSAILLMVLSPGYLASQWCRQEKDLFFEGLGGEPQDRVFVVEKQVLDEDQARPAELADVKGYRFWYQDEHDQARTLSLREPEPHATTYIRLVEDLATDISRQLKARAATVPPLPAEPRATVFLAEVTDDVDSQREQVRRYLEQAQLRVLPARRHLEGQAFRDALDQALSQSTLFIQLLSAYPGRRPPDIPQGYTRLQLERAQALKLPIVQWHDPTLKLGQVESQEQRELLEGVSVYAEPLESFKQRSVQQALPPSPLPPVVTRIFLCHAKEDKPQVRDVYRRLQAEGFAPWLDEEALLQLVDLPGSPLSTAIAPDGKSVAVGFDSGALRLYSLPEMHFLEERKDAHSNQVLRLSFDADGTLLASASFDNTAKLWAVAPDGTLTERQTFSGYTDAVHGLAFSPDGTLLATASYDGRVGLFTVGTQEKRFIDAHEGHVGSVAFDNSGYRLLSAGIEDKTVRLWDLITNPPTQIQAFPKAQDKLLWATLSLDGQAMASVGRDQVVEVYSTQDIQLLHRLVGHEQTVYRAIFSPDGHQLATVSWDATLRLWDLDTGGELFSLRLPTHRSPPPPLWDFDFRCTPTGCWIAVPLTRGKLALYEFGKIDD